MANGLKVAWNKDKSRSVVLAKLKEFSIDRRASGWAVKGWFNRENAFVFGEWDTEAEARNFLESVHKLF